MKSSEFQKFIPPCKIDDIPERLVGFCSLLRTSTSPQTRRLRSFLSYSWSDGPYMRPCRRNLNKICLDASSDFQFDSQLSTSTLSKNPNGKGACVPTVNWSGSLNFFSLSFTQKNCHNPTQHLRARHYRAPNQYKPPPISPTSPFSFRLFVQHIPSPFSCFSCSSNTSSHGVHRRYCLWCSH